MDTMEPASISTSISDGLLEGDGDGDEPEQRVPPVVAVVVTSNPGPWLEETLGALAIQDYPALSVLVLDNGSADDPTGRIAAVLPTAFVRRREQNDGFAAAANDALASVEGATFLLFCHDDVVLDADAISVMVEEAYRSNAAIVGPKVVDHDHPEILLEVGMAVDHYAVPFSGIEPEEVDQEQHDAVRDVFYVSHTAMLVRADLFQELSGFDAATFPGSDDVDLCWRARLAGARVVVAPSARVLHRRATVVEARPARLQPANERRAETRARIRVICKSYSTLALLWVLPVAFVLAIAEAIGLVFTGRLARARAGIAGWFSAFAHPGELRRARRETQKLRRVDDGDVRDLMIRGSSRVRTYVARRMHAGERFAVVSSRTKVRMDAASAQLRRAPAIIAVVLGVLLFFGTRSLLFGRVPEVGAFRAWPGIGDAWSTFTGAWRVTLMGAPEAATPAFGLMAVLNTLLLGNAGMARSLVIALAIPVGTIGAYRLARPFATSALPGVAAAVAYAANPIARNAVWRGQLGPLVCFALAPFVFRAFVRLLDDDVDRRSRVHITLTIALLVAVCGSVWPPAIALGALFAVAFVITLPFAGTTKRALVGAGVGLAASALAALLLAPWSFSLFGADGATWGALPREALSIGDLLQFHTGRAGAGLVAWGIVAAAVVPLAIATGPRFAWAARSWTLAALSFAIAWIPAQSGDGATALAPDGVLVLSAISLAFAAGLGIAAVLDDLRRFHFGWRQVMTIVGVVGLSAALLGLAADTFSGRFGLDGDDWPKTYSWMGENSPPGGFRVLWVGDPTILPADPKVAGTVGFATTRDGPGDARALWAAPEQSADRLLAQSLEAATAGDTARLGHLVAPTGVRYIAFIRRAAPDSGARGSDQTALSNALARQLDLTLSRVDDESIVYENDAWIPMRADISAAESTRSDESNALGAALRSEPDGVAGLAVKDGKTEAAGPGALLWSEAANDNWHASADGRDLERRDAFGWTNEFTLDTNAPVAVSYDGGSSNWLLRLAEVLLTLAVIGGWFVTRQSRKRRATVSATSSATSGPVVSI